jgi:hypothetical protein
VPTLPPEVEHAERNGGEPEDSEAEHPEEHPGADPSCRRLPGQPRTEPGVEPEHDEDEELAEHEEEAGDALEVACPFDNGRAEGLLDVHPWELESRRDVCLRQKVDGDCIARRDRGEHAAEEEAPAASDHAGASSGSASGEPSASGRLCNGPLSGYRPVTRKR